MLARLTTLLPLPLLPLLALAAGPSRPDSRLARNVLEGKAEGYCSVRLPPSPTPSYYTDPNAAIRPDRIHALPLRDRRIPKLRAFPCSEQTGRVSLL